MNVKEMIRAVAVLNDNGILFAASVCAPVTVALMMGAGAGAIIVAVVGAFAGAIITQEIPGVLAHLRKAVASPYETSTMAAIGAMGAYEKEAAVRHLVDGTLPEYHRAVIAEKAISSAKSERKNLLLRLKQKKTKVATRGFSYFAA